jgi:hypothetical protein
MAIRDWTPQTIRRIWLVVAVVQLAILLPGMLRLYRRQHPPPLPPAADSVPGIFTGRDSADREALLTELRDSLGVIVEVRGDTVTSVAPTPEGEARLRALAVQLRPQFAGLNQIGRGVVPFLFAVLLMAFSPTLAASALAIYWLWTRRRPAAAPVLSDS